MKIEKDLGWELIHSSPRTTFEDWTLVDDTGWVSDGKYDIRTAVLLHEGKYWQVDLSRTGSYYTDYHHSDEGQTHWDLYEVFPMQTFGLTWNRVTNG